MKMPTGDDEKVAQLMEAVASLNSDLISVTTGAQADVTLNALTGALTIFTKDAPLLLKYGFGSAGTVSSSSFDEVIPGGGVIDRLGFERDGLTHVSLLAIGATTDVYLIEKN